MEQTNPSVLEERRIFIKIREAGQLLEWVGNDKSDTLERRAIRATLNLYEFVAIGIRESTLDGRLYKRSYRTTVVGDWIALKPFVMQLRILTRTPTLFCEFDALARKWADARERPRV